MKITVVTIRLCCLFALGWATADLNAWVIAPLIAVLCFSCFIEGVLIEPS